MQKIVWDKPKLYIGDELIESTYSTLSSESLPLEFEEHDAWNMSNLTFTFEVKDINVDVFNKLFLCTKKNWKKEIRSAWARQDYLWLALKMIEIASTYRLMNSNPIQNEQYRYALRLYKRKPRKYTYKTLKK